MKNEEKIKNCFLLHASKDSLGHTPDTDTHHGHASIGQSLSESGKIFATQRCNQSSAGEYGLAGSVSVLFSRRCVR